jgi:hypothetical protein
MSYYGNYDFKLMVSRGLIPDHYPVNKFGAAPDGVQTTLTDIWGRADATPTQQIWLAPTVARLHLIRSSSPSDDGSPVGVGARTIRIYGLNTWSSIETSEDIIMNGVTDVTTVSSYVIINQMKVLTSGATAINVGTIVAVAQTDATVSAVILAGKGETQLAILGVPSTQNLYIENYHASIHDTTNSKATFFLVANENPNVQTTNFITKHNFGITSDGNSSFDYVFEIPYKIEGPAIIKLQAIGSAADLDCSAAFDGYLITE